MEAAIKWGHQLAAGYFTATGVKPQFIKRKVNRAG